MAASLNRPSTRQRVFLHGVCATTLLLCLIDARTAAASPIVLLDDFEDGTTENWFAGGGPLNEVPPNPPTNVATGGPAGAGDNFLLLTAIGGGGPGSRLVAMNGSQWAFDYVAGNVALIEMDVQNLSNTDLALRLLFEDPSGGPPTNVAGSTVPIIVPSGSGWVHVVFPITQADLTAFSGTALGALANATLVRLYHDPGPIAEFPGPPIAAQLGVDNISATINVVPEPSLLLLSVVGGVLAARRYRRSPAERRCCKNVSTASR